MADNHITTKDDPNAFANNISYIRTQVKSYFSVYVPVYGSTYGALTSGDVDAMTDAQVIKIYDNEDYFFEQQI